METLDTNRDGGIVQSERGLPSVEKANVRERGTDCREAKAITEGEEHAEIDPPLLLIRRHIDLELIVDDSGDVVRLAGGREQIGGEDGEGLGVVQVEAPVSERDGDVHEQSVADEDVDDGEEGTDEGAEEEGGDGSPVEGEGADAESLEPGPDLLSGDRLGEHPADPGDVGDGWEEVAGDCVPCEAADECDDEELGSRHPTIFLLMQRPEAFRLTIMISTSEYELEKTKL